MMAMGQKDQFPPRRLNVRYLFRYMTFAGISANGQDARFQPFA
jgi:hypothetical protein